MIPSIAIERAIEGGWQPMDYSRPKGTRNTDPIIKIELLENIEMVELWHKDFGRGGGIKTVVAFPIIALDPAFWSALGKALEWGSFYDTEGMPRYHVPMLQGWYPTTTTGSGYDEQAWQGVALYFLDLILTTQDTSVFWQEILATNETK